MFEYKLYFIQLGNVSLRTKSSQLAQRALRSPISITFPLREKETICDSNS